MINIRQISNIQKDGGQYTLVNVKVVAENPGEQKTAMASKEVNAMYTNVSDLFDAIQGHVVELVTSGLI